MSKVWVVIDRTWELGIVCGVFYDKEKALEKIKWLRENAPLPEEVEESLRNWDEREEVRESIVRVFTLSESILE